MQLRFADSSVSRPLQIICADIPDGAMPGDLTLGQSMHAKLAMQYLPDYSVTLGDTSLAMYEGQNMTLRPIANSGKNVELLETCCTVRVEHDNELPPEVVQFKKEFKVLFEPKGRRFARVEGTLHKIDTGNTRPFKAQAARCNPIHRLSMRLFVERALAEGVVRESKSLWASRALAVPKGEKSLPKPTPEQLEQRRHTHRYARQSKPRICVNYRTPNSIMVRDSHSLPNVEDASAIVSSSFMRSSKEKTRMINGDTALRTVKRLLRLVPRESGVWLMSRTSASRDEPIGNTLSQPDGE